MSSVYIMETKKDVYLSRVRERIKEIRQLLDAAMYGGDELPDEEYSKLREAYDLICKANDKL